jgi:hypothetical protein
MSLGTAPNPLIHRLAVVRRRLRVTTAWRGGAWLVAVAAAAVTLLGTLDWRFHLPSLVRAFGLVATLAAAGAILYRLLFRPLAAPSDDLSLALRIETEYPELNDGLASAVEFLDQSEETDRQAATLRDLAVKQAVRKAEDCDFNRIVNARGLLTAGLAMLIALVPTVGLAVAAPVLARTALLRLADPFSARDWPLQTEWSDVAARSRIGRGEPFDIRARVRGVLPDDAVVRLATADGTPTGEIKFPVTHDPSPEHGSFFARLDTNRTQKNFRFQLVANDAVSPWYSVAVLTPPSLAPLEGRPSAQATLTFPAYTDLPAMRLPDGTSNIEVVAGTQVSLRAATDRPVVVSWIGFTPDGPQLPAAAALGPLGATNPLQAIALHASGEPVWGHVPARLDTDNKKSLLSVNFTPYVSGTYALHIEDDAGLGGQRLFEVRVFPDPAPTVGLERPNASLDSLLVVPDAEITVRASAQDTQYALRSVALEYRCEKGPKSGREPLYDHGSAGAALSMALSPLAGPIPTPAPPLRLRPTRLDLGERFSLTHVRHTDGSRLREGDVVVLQAIADDFDNVAVDKQPGRSSEVELRVVSPAILEALLQQAQAQVQQELVRLRELQRDGRNKVDALEKQWKNTGKLRPEDLEALFQAEQNHEQIRGRIGTPKEGLRAEAAKILHTMRDNHLQNSGARERMEMVLGDLERLFREELAPVGPLLTQARKENELAPDDASRHNPLAEAERHQQEVERTLNDLLSRLDPFSTSRQLRAEAKAILQEEQRLIEATKNVNADNDPQSKADRERLAERQQRAAEQLADLLSKLQKMGETKIGQATEKRQKADQMEAAAEEKEREAKKAEGPQADRLKEEARALRREAAQLREAADTLAQEGQALQQARNAGFGPQIPGQMSEAAHNLRDGQPNNAARKQVASANGIEQVIRALEDRREEDLDKLVKKLRAAEKKLAELEDAQDRLQKKTREAKKIADPEQREAELKRLAREQEKLRQETQEMAQTLTRLRAGQAGQELGQADGAMQEAGQRLERGGGDEQQEEALQQMQQAKQQLKEAREQAEEELGRERLFKPADQIKRLRERQEALLQETDRIQTTLLAREGWKNAPGLISSVSAERNNQQALAEEAAALAKGKLASAKVFARLLERAGGTMTQASLALGDRYKKHARSDAPFDAAMEEADDLAIRRSQKDTLRLLDQMIVSLKPEDGPNRIAAKEGSNGGGGSGGGGGAKESDGIPPLAQLKALKAFQEDVRLRTEQFAHDHQDPKAGKLTAQEQETLDALHRDQSAISELLDELTAPPGGKP